jgi:hypothetical protein
MRSSSDVSPGLLRLIRKTFRRSLVELIKDPGFRARVVSVDLTRLPSSTRRAGMTLLKVKVLTCNRPLMLGSFVYFPNTSMRGFHNEYIATHLERALRDSKAVGSHEEVLVALDVIPTRGSRERLYRTLTLRQACRAGILDSSSPLACKMREYGLRSVLLAGSEVSAPNLTMIEAVESACARWKPARCLDVFSGTGALAKVALANGATTVDCIEWDPSLPSYREAHVPARALDAWAARPRGRHDLVIVDPFYDWAMRAASELVPRIAPSAKCLVFNVGYVYDEYWVGRVKRELRRLPYTYEFLSGFENIVAIGCRV